MKTQKQTVEKQFNDEGQKIIEAWYLNNELYREDGPAFQQWNDNGQKIRESWYLNDKFLAFRIG